MTAETPELTERYVVSLLQDYVDCRESESEAKRAKEFSGSIIRDWLDRHDGPLLDGEHHIEASLQTRSGAAVYEMERMPDDLVLALHRLGALKVDAAVIRAHTGKEIADRVKPFSRPGPATTALQVQEKK